MTLNCTWQIRSLEVIPELAGQQNVVSKVNWLLTATNGVHTYAIGDMELLEYDPKVPFIPYENLSEQVVLDWVFESMGELRIHWLIKLVNTKLKEISMPKLVAMPPPWMPITTGHVATFQV